MTPTQQRAAVKLIKRGLVIKDVIALGNGISGEVDDRHTHDMRIFLIELGEIPDRRKRAKK